MSIYLDTCVLPRSLLETGRLYRDRFGSSLGFELLMMFDLPDFEQDLKRNLDLFLGGPLLFHEPVWGVEHSAPKGSPAYEEGMYHLRLTRKYAAVLQPSAMVYHLSNCIVPPGEKDRMLRTSLENLEEIRDMFPAVNILVENTGTVSDGTLLLSQAEFTDLCRSRGLPVLIDVGHANANGWDLPRLVQDLKKQICGFHLHNNDGVHDMHHRLMDGTLDFRTLIPLIDREVPDVPRVIEYCDPSLHGEPLLEDIGILRRLSASDPLFLSAMASAGQASQPGRLNPDHILLNMDEAVCFTAMNGDLLYTNSVAEKLFGIHPREEKKIWDAIPFVEQNDALIQLFIDSVMKKQRSVHSLVDYVNNDGQLYNLHVSLTCDQTGSGMFLIVISDLTSLIKVHSAFQRYTSPEIADYVLSTPEGEKQGGQTREVSILMSDLRGFTAMSTHLSSSDLIVVLNHYFECMSAVIDRYHGTIIEFLGDGLFVVFGAPKELPDHAAAAARCAVEMQNAMADVNRWNRENGYPDLEMGIGIHSGPAVVGNIGSDRRMKYGCMGATVNLAGRLESITVSGQIMISESTLKQISFPVTVIDEQSIMPKGADQELKIYDITAVGENCALCGTDNTADWKILPSPIDVCYSLLDGKIVDTVRYEGRITRISFNERYGILVTGDPLQKWQNLMCEVGTQTVYAKVLDCHSDGNRICFTSKPEGFSFLNP